MLRCVRIVWLDRIWSLRGFSDWQALTGDVVLRVGVAVSG